MIGNKIGTVLDLSPGDEVVIARPRDHYEEFHAGQPLMVVAFDGDSVMVECEDEHSFLVPVRNLAWYVEDGR